MSTIREESIAGLIRRVDTDENEEEDLLAIISRRSNGTAHQIEQDKLVKIAIGGQQEGSNPGPSTATSASTSRKKGRKGGPQSSSPGSPSFCATKDPEQGDSLLKAISKHSREYMNTSEATAAFKSDPELEIMKVIAARSKEPSPWESSWDDDSNSEEEVDMEDEEEEERTAYSRHAKKRIEGPLQPGAFEAAPGEQLSRLHTLSFSALNDNKSLEDQDGSCLLKRTNTRESKEQHQKGLYHLSTTEPNLLVPIATATLVTEEEDRPLAVVLKEKNTKLQEMEREIQALHQRLANMTAKVVSGPEATNQAVKKEAVPKSLQRKPIHKESTKPVAPGPTAVAPKAALVRCLTVTAPKSPRKPLRKACTMPSSYKYDKEMTAGENFALDFLLNKGKSRRERSSSREAKKSKNRWGVFYF